MRVDIPRRIYKQGQVSIRYLAVSLLIVGLVLVAATLLILEKLILSRLFRLSADVYNIGTTGNLSARVLSLTGKDELSSLGSTINEMLAALEHSLNKEREREKRHYSQNKTLAELAKRKMLEFSNLNARLTEITEAAARTLKVERVSVWLYNDEQSKLRCINLYERSTNQLFCAR